MTRIWYEYYNGVLIALCLCHFEPFDLLAPLSREEFFNKEKSKLSECDKEANPNVTDVKKFSKLKDVWIFTDGHSPF